ncbi:MAG: hypothetical protein PHI23_02800 [Candidatus Peribacteraceae bacterium]|nr:hypothetical protein [Candidatus Peribacteraceae bacterium]
MNSRAHLVVKVLMIIAAGVLLGVGAVQYTQLNATLSTEHFDTVYRNRRSVREAKLNGIEDEGRARPNYEWRTQRTEKAPGTVSTETEDRLIEGRCQGQSTYRQPQCIVNYLNGLTKLHGTAK